MRRENTEGKCLLKSPFNVIKMRPFVVCLSCYIVAVFMIICQARPIYASQAQVVAERDDILKLLISQMPPSYEIAWTFGNPRRPAVMMFNNVIILVLGQKGEIYANSLVNRPELDVPLNYDQFLIMTVQQTETGPGSETHELEAGDIILNCFFTEDVTNDSSDEIIVNTDSGGTGGFSTLFIFSLKPDGLKTLWTAACQEFEILRLGEHKKKVIVIEESVGQGAGACSWKDIYQWDGKNFIMADEKFPEFYSEMIQEYMNDDGWKGRFITGRAYEVLKKWKEAGAEYEKALEALKEEPSDCKNFKEEILERLEKIKKD